jgi:hypothetical protein
MPRKARRRRAAVEIPVSVREQAYGGAGSALLVELLRSVLLADSALVAEDRLRRLLSIMPEETVKKAEEAMRRAEQEALEDPEFLSLYLSVQERRRRFLISGPAARRIIREELARRRVEAALRAVSADLRRYIFILVERITGVGGQGAQPEGGSGEQLAG